MKKLVIQILSSKLFLIVTLFLYRALIDLSYIHIISPAFAYLGLSLDMNQSKIVESYILLFVFSLILKHKISKPSEFFILFLFSILIIPILSIYSLKDKSREFLYMVLLSFLVIIISSKMPQIKIPIIRKGSKIAISISMMTAMLLFSWIISRGGLSHLNFNLLRVYEFRSTAAELFFPGVLSYAMTWFGKVMNPLIIAYSLWKKSKKMVIVSIGLQVLFFAITALKSMLFYPFLIIFAYVFGNRKYFGQMVPLGLMIITFISSIFYLVFDNIIPITLFVRRVLFVTADNHYRYYDTFNKLGFIYFSDRVWFPKIIEYPFDLPVPQLISLIYIGRTDVWTNTGFLATGYTHFGFAGMIVYSIIVGIIFRFIDYIANNFLPTWFCIAIMITPVFDLISADLPTALITHGILLAMVMLWLVSGDSEKYGVNLKVTVPMIKK